MLWTLVVPVKPLAAAKSRLVAGAARLPGPALALAFALDTVGAALACGAVRDVAVVTADPLAGARLAALGARVLPEPPGGGLNAAWPTARSKRAGYARTRPWPRSTRICRIAPRRTRAGARIRRRISPRISRGCRRNRYDPAGGDPGKGIVPAFEGASRARHRASGAEEITLTGVDSVRRDVDTERDLLAALALGVGPRTAAVAGRARAAGAPSPARAD